MMDETRDGITSPAGQRRITGPPGHTKMCWASALGLARRGRPPEDFTVSAGRAVELLADPAVCRCVPENNPRKRPR